MRSLLTRPVLVAALTAFVVGGATVIPAGPAYADTHVYCNEGINAGYSNGGSGSTYWGLVSRKRRPVRQLPSPDRLPVWWRRTDPLGLGIGARNRLHAKRDLLVRWHDKRLLDLERLTV
jgi:hypothetical protein